MAESPHPKFPYRGISGAWIAAETGTFVSALWEGGIASKQALAQLHKEKPGYGWGFALIGFWNFLYSSGCCPATGWPWQGSPDSATITGQLRVIVMAACLKQYGEKCCLGNVKRWSSTKWPSRWESPEILEIWVTALDRRKISQKKFVEVYFLLLRQAEQGPVGSTHSVSLGQWRWLDRLQERAGLGQFYHMNPAKNWEEPTESVLLQLTSPPPRGTRRGLGECRLPEMTALGNIPGMLKNKPLNIL